MKCFYIWVLIITSIGMKKIIFIALLLFANLVFSQAYSQNLTASVVTDIEGFTAPTYSENELDDFGIKANMEIGEVMFQAPNKVDHINIYNADDQEIFSALGTIIENNKIDISFLPSGTYYLEVIIGDNMGSHKLIRE